jgi:hypothetical protein
VASGQPLAPEMERFLTFCKVTLTSLHIAAFDDRVRQHGGVRRSAQLRERALADGAEVIDFPRSRLTAAAMLVRAPLSTLRVSAITLALGLRFLSLRGVIATLVYGTWLHAQLRRRGWPHVHLETAPGVPIILGLVLASLRESFTAYPHNIEFMVPYQRLREFRSHVGAIDAELRIMRHAREIFTISSFDSLVLHCFQLEAVRVLPYEPATGNRAALAAIARTRAAGVMSDFILIIGSTMNPPTRIGIERLLMLIAAEQENRSFVLVGFGTEALTSLAPPNVEVRGSVAQGELDSLMSRCAAMLIYQPPTSGMLTRMVEATLCGISVYVMGGYAQANELAGRGVTPIANLCELQKSDRKQ